MTKLSGGDLSAIVLINYVVSSISAVGSLGIILFYASFPDLRNFSYTLVFWMAVSELAYAASNLIGNPSDGSAECYAQAILQSYSILAAILWNLVIAYVLKNAILFPQKMLGITKRLPYFHLYCWGAPLVLTVLPIATHSYGNSIGWCWIKGTTAGEFWRFFQFYLPLWAVMGYNIQMYMSVREALNEVRGISGNTLLYFPIILVFCWFFGSINRIQNIISPERPKSWLFMLQVIFGNSQGFWHFLAYSSTPPVRQALGNFFGYDVSDSESRLGIDGSDGLIHRGSDSSKREERFETVGSEHLRERRSEVKGPVNGTRRRSSTLQDVSHLVRGAYLRELGIYQLIGINTKKTNVMQVYDILQEKYTLRATAPIPSDSIEEGEESAMVPADKTTTTGAYLTLMKAFVGIGILAIPGAYAQAGYILATVFLVLIAVVSYYCAMLLVKTKNRITGGGESMPITPSGSAGSLEDSKFEGGVHGGEGDAVVTFQELGYRVLGMRGKRLVEGGIVACQLSFVCAYFLFIGDSCARVIDKDGFLSSGMFFTLVATVGVVPLLYLKSIKLLVIPAILADVIIVFGLFVIFAYDIIQIDKVHETIQGFRFQGLPLFFGIAVFAFEGINMILPVEQSMAEPKKFPGVLRQVFLHLTIAMVLIGALSYSAFGKDTKNPILFSLPDNDLIKSVQIMYAIALFFSVPLQMFPAFNILESYDCFQSIFCGNLYLHRFVIILCVGGVASVIPNFGLFLNVVGAVGGTAVAFILPSYLYMAARKQYEWRPIAACVFGLIGGTIAFAVSIMQFANGG
mmetsp:Transcript_10616/g.25966  ORF Transcript_10616/g.25966 Transcript_10616/m.25966 type:complete len:800 (-) Transcript_10616:247-2646(-)|eukprot:CAMPEP_0114510094 /NCGR_PEP_ID=MMETSP0109-20121206/13590_1 /TAXON_ID=29199 /ORGANISM="Chlorarachnion reptans, Strain CCCM449" /LENGTH=799 /DNA_ID=CAMNT_0001689351 /DNA_START=165 /DNA_END=2564 /DNA_ORIENTATION=-